MCQANIIGHWLEGAPTPEERLRRMAALEAIMMVDEHGDRHWDGPSVLDLIRRWDRSFEWVPGQDRGVLVYAPDGRLVETSQFVRTLLTR